MDAGTLKLLRQLSPTSYLRPGLPPFLLMQGDSDKTVFPPLTVNFAAQLKENGVPCELYFLKGAGHRIADWEEFDPAWQQKLVGWLKPMLAIKK
jgi:dipeptidyl aminopeptidase/acylaminoacyl peptidase